MKAHETVPPSISNVTDPYSQGSPIPIGLAVIIIAPSNRIVPVKLIPEFTVNVGWVAPVALYSKRPKPASALTVMVLPSIITKSSPSGPSGSDPEI